MSADHVILTRFNLPSVGVESLIRAHDGWLRARVELFEHYCLPSVRAQSDLDFSWIIYFDPESPAWLMEWIDTQRDEGIFHPVFRASVSTPQLLSDIGELIGTPRSWLMTTNLDNDDAIALDFVARLHAIAPPTERTAVYLSNGLIASQDDLYLRTDRHNAFCSVIEPWDRPVTCWADWHNRLSLQMSARSIGGPPAWLQVIHGSNVSNRVRGRLVSPAAYRGLFGNLLAEAPAPGRSKIARDRIVTGPARFTRETVRATAKWGAVRLFGTSGLDRIKLRLAHASRPTGGG